MFDLTGKVAIVTGASSGLGVQFAHALARQGAKLAIAARRKEKLDHVAKSIRELGVECLPITCDLTKEEDIINSVKTVYDHYGKIDILVNNAGVGIIAPLVDMTTKQWDQVLDTDLRGMFIFSREVGKHFIDQQSGKIINISSSAGYKGSMYLHMGAYNAAKAGVINFTRAMAGEWGKYNINVNCIGPGLFPNEGYENLDDEGVEFLKSTVPLGRPGVNGEMDATLLLLASDEGSYITGQTIFVDGGITAI